MDITKHPVLMKFYLLMIDVEGEGASEELTDCVVKLQEAMDFFERHRLNLGE